MSGAQVLTPGAMLPAAETGGRMSERRPIGPENIRRAMVGMPRGVSLIADMVADLCRPGWLLAEELDERDRQRGVIEMERRGDLLPHMPISWRVAAADIARVQSLDLAIAQRLEHGRFTPEGEARWVWIYYLLWYGKYEGAQFDLEVSAGAGRDAEKEHISVRADIVIYRDNERTRPWIVIEVKAEGIGGGFLQAQSYARNLGATYFAVVVGDDWQAFKAYRTGLFGSPSEPVDRLPGYFPDLSPTEAEMLWSEHLREGGADRV